MLIGLAKSMLGLPWFNTKARRNPVSPIGPKIRAKTMDAGFKSNFFAKYPKIPKANITMTSNI